MSAGALRHRLAFEAPTRTVNDFGEAAATGWPEQCRAWGQLIYQSGGEAVAAAREAGRQSIKVKIRQSVAARSIAAGWRMRDLTRGLLFDIKEADSITQRDFVFLVVEGPLPE